MERFETPDTEGEGSRKPEAVEGKPGARKLEDLVD